MQVFHFAKKVCSDDLSQSVRLTYSQSKLKVESRRRRTRLLYSKVVALLEIKRLDRQRQDYAYACRSLTSTDSMSHLFHSPHPK